MRDLLLLLLVAFALPASAQDTCDNCGRIVSIKQVTVTTQWTPLGAMSPGTLQPSGVGEQPGQVTTSYIIGKGGKNEGQVLLGSAGGAGYAKRSGSSNQQRWEVTVKMDKGPQRVLQQAYEPLLQEGDRVQVFGTQLELINP
jgi:outer membrane lipoprotein SlyB